MLINLNFRLLNLALILLPLLVACDQNFGSGFLLVKAKRDFRYEIYRIANTKPLQYVAEHTGQFNEKVPLDPGRYLVLADCSHQYIIIKPNETKVLHTSLLEFVPPEKSLEADTYPSKLAIQCNRTREGDFRQNLKNRYQIFLLPGSHSLLVGMKPLIIDVPLSISEPQSKQVQLSGIRVEDSLSAPKSDYRYFVSSNEENLAFTEQTYINQWILLLPGSYTISLHGTERNIELGSNQAFNARVGYLQVNSPPKVDLEEITAVSGKPLALTINKKHLLPLNRKYALLEGKNTLQLNDSTQKKVLYIEPGQFQKVELNAVKASLECAPWEWSCLGGKEVQLFEKGAYYPFVESQTDIPILYFKAEISVGLTSSRDLKLTVNEEKRFSNLKIGILEIIPEYRHIKGKISDLVRLEPANEHFKGFSLDISPASPSKLYLLEGRYKLANYIANTSYEGDRTAAYRNVRIRPGYKRTMKVTYLVSERNLKKYSEIKEKRIIKKQEKAKNRKDKSQPSIKFF